MQGSGLTGKFVCINSCCRDKPYSTLKSGQTTMDREYYDKATQEKPNGQRCLSNFQRFETDYSARISLNTKLGDFKVPSKDANQLSKYDV